MHLVYLSLGFFTTSSYLFDFAFVAIMTSQYNKNHLLNQSHNLHQDHMSVQGYIAIFEDLISRSDVRDHRSEIITRGFKA